jgi:SAM-dependent methyltransferase
MPTHSGIEAHVHAMKGTDADTAFRASIPMLYETYLVPLIFERYAADLANRLACRSVSRVLELAAGTGALTRALAFALPENVGIVATDLNQPMLDQGSALGTTRPVQWLSANAMQLPFENGTFDAVVCQFGAMFFAEKATAFSEARRVLRPGGVFIFNTWDRIEENEFADAVTTALESLFPKDPPRFLARIPHGYHDRAAIQRDLADAGFLASPQITTVVACSRAKSSWIPAIAYCQGTPLRSEIEARDPSRLDEATSIAANAIGRRFGQGSVEGKMQAHIVAVEN